MVNANAAQEAENVEVLRVDKLPIRWLQLRAETAKRKETADSVRLYALRPCLRHC